MVLAYSISFSMGGMYLIEEWILSVLYQWTHSAVAASTSTRDFHVVRRRGCSISSVLYRPIVDSISALSRASPTLPMEPAIPASSRASVNAIEVYCEPASEWCTRPVVVNSASCRRRVASACSTALDTSAVSLVLMTRQPRMRREYTSVMNETYTNPVSVHT